MIMRFLDVQKVSRLTRSFEMAMCWLMVRAAAPNPLPSPKKTRQFESGLFRLLDIRSEVPKQGWFQKTSKEHAMNEWPMICLIRLAGGIFSSVLKRSARNGSGGSWWSPIPFTASP